MTALLELREPLRHLLGDSDSSAYQYSDARLDMALRTMVLMGKLQGYSLHSNRTSITPTIATPNELALLLYETVRSFVAANPDGSSWKTRAGGMSFSGYKNFLAQLEERIHELKAGSAFESWQNFEGWWVGNLGLSTFGLMTRMNLDTPTRQVSLGSDGISVG